MTMLFFIDMPYMGWLFIYLLLHRTHLHGGNQNASITSLSFIASSDCLKWLCKHPTKKCVIIFDTLFK